MLESLVFKPFTEENLDAATEVFVQVFAAEPWNEVWPHESARRRLGDIVRSPGFVGRSAFCDGELIAFVLGRLEPYRDEQHFYMQEMCVSSQFRRRGVGTRLLTDLEVVLKELGCLQVYLLTARESEAALFHSANKFRPARRVGVFVKNRE